MLYNSSITKRTFINEELKRRGYKCSKLAKRKLPLVKIALNKKLLHEKKNFLFFPFSYMINPTEAYVAQIMMLSID